MTCSTRRNVVGYSVTALAAVISLSSSALAQSTRRASFPVVQAESVGMSTERLHRVTAALQKHIDDKHISGAVALVARKGKVVYYEQIGSMNIETNEAMRTDALFAMASSTKPVTATAIMMLVEEGKVRLTDPVSRFIPEFKQMNALYPPSPSRNPVLVVAAREITIKDLLTHMSGLGTGGDGQKAAPSDTGFPTSAGETLASYVPRLAKMALDFQPGTQWRYSGLAGIDVLARVVEIASGTDFNTFLRNRIFEPLGMTDTVFVVPEDRKTRIAGLHRFSEGKIVRADSFLRFPPTYFCGAGGLTSTAADFWRFGQMLANGGELAGKRLLSPRSVQLMSTNHAGDLFPGNLGRPKGMGFGFAMEVVVNNAQASTFRTNGSFGWDGAFGTHFWADPKEQLVAVMMIQTNVGYLVRADFETAVLQAIVK